jgi:hypothetical protein
MYPYKQAQNFSQQMQQYAKRSVQVDYAFSKVLELRGDMAQINDDEITYAKVRTPSSLNSITTFSQSWSSTVMKTWSFLWAHLMVGNCLYG